MTSREREREREREMVTGRRKQRDINSITDRLTESEKRQMHVLR